MPLSIVKIGDTQDIAIAFDFDPSGGTLRYVVKSDLGLADADAEINRVETLPSSMTIGSDGKYHYTMRIPSNVTKDVPARAAPYYYDLQWSDTSVPPVVRTLSPLYSRIVYAEEVAKQ